MFMLYNLQMIAQILSEYEATGCNASTVEPVDSGTDIVASTDTTQSDTKVLFSDNQYPFDAYRVTSKKLKATNPTLLSP